MLSTRCVQTLVLKDSLRKFQKNYHKILIAALVGSRVPSPGLPSPTLIPQSWTNKINCPGQTFLAGRPSVHKNYNTRGSCQSCWLIQLLTAIYDIYVYIQIRLSYKFRGAFKSQICSIWKRAALLKCFQFWCSEKFLDKYPDRKFCASQFQWISASHHRIRNLNKIEKKIYFW